MNKKIVGIFILCLFIGTVVIPCISGNIVDTNKDYILTSYTDDYDIYTITYCTDDSDIYEFFPDENCGNRLGLHVQPDLICNNKSYQFEAWIFIRFNLYAIPSDSKIVNAELYLWCMGHGLSPIGRKIDCYRVTSSWAEENITWNNKPSFFSDIITSSSIVPSELKDLVMIWDVTSDLQGFINGSYLNYGWMLKDRNDNIPIGNTACSIGFSSKDCPYDSPLLIVKTIKVKAKNISSEKSNMKTLKISMPKIYIHNLILERLIRMVKFFPFFEKILNQII